MADPKLNELPTEAALDKMNSVQLTDVSASLTDSKDKILAEYKRRQDKLHKLIEREQKKEQQSRIKSDSGYWDKHQGIGVPRK